VRREIAAATTRGMRWAHRLRAWLERVLEADEARLLRKAREEAWLVRRLEELRRSRAERRR
jgi:hypothetical protein